jgi:bacterial/archaeal transporter family protein
MLPLVLTTLSFGTLPIIYKMLLLKGINKITILVITKILIAIMGITLLLIGNNNTIVHKDIANIMKKETYIPVTLLILLSAIVYFIGQYYYIESLDNYDANITTIITSSYPVITLILAYLYLSETLTYYQVIGCLLIFTGVIMIGY